MSMARQPLRHSAVGLSLRLQSCRRCCRSFSSFTARRRDEPRDDEPKGDELRNYGLQEEGPVEPRWKQTPPMMKAPFSLNTPKKERAVWKVNEDPDKLDKYYERLMGTYLAKTIPEEMKWLAVTHKSFDNGRRGFNTKLAYFGRQILAVEAMRSIMLGPTPTESPTPDPHGREPFQHPALANVDKLSLRPPQEVFSVEKISKLASHLGTFQIMRWHPRTDSLKSSGVDVVLNHVILAIIGAVSMQNGAEVANKFVRERILRRLKEADETARA